MGCIPPGEARGGEGAILPSIMLAGVRVRACACSRKPFSGACLPRFVEFPETRNHTCPRARTGPEGSVTSPWYRRAAGIAGVAGSGTGHVACRGLSTREGDGPGYAAQYPRIPARPASGGGRRRLGTRWRCAVAWSMSAATGRRRQHGETARVDELPSVVKQGAGKEQDVLEGAVLVS